jgi:retinal rod rhodopsin-sensitive cGMP 3',5'-cyclic phosphodiesterase subunit delta|eukprot:scaffold3011_cov133-Chaetoceros_neogracile.AAC.8
MSEETTEVIDEPKPLEGSFQIKSIQMSDVESKEVLWKSQFPGSNDWEKDQIEIRLPREILSCSAVAREIEFSSQDEIQELRLIQKVLLHDHLIEEWDFSFGFVIPSSTNTWQNIIVSSPEVMDASVLSGNVTIETSFYDKDTIVAQSVWSIFYD